ncbi:hypothetical protein [Parvibaculum sp.]|jgi:hypothetical protein|uniref:hypothetical protein n=1 Tax=Parvibaculum sp. TaxID=2024848 RepID=UPI000C38B3EA|nr:hypothetical protein [Parvibaculum sp.]MAM93845.1 hypothetical protein [Parvibaculum sp.]|tara:strand:+ start:11040 stop:11390 length:351 start_codon:yes stop_codon:yes gene_type:complete
MRPVHAFFLATAAVTIFVLPAQAEMVTATGSLIKKDTYGTEEAWGRTLKLPEGGKVVRVMDGTYGFSILNAKGDAIADFLLPQDAVGLELAPGEYKLSPYVCAQHRHHHVEVTVEY